MEIIEDKNQQFIREKRKSMKSTFDSQKSNRISRSLIRPIK